MRPIVLALLAASFIACKDEAKPAMTEEDLANAANAALQVGDYGKAIDLAMPRAQAGDPEYLFGVGYLALSWLLDDAPKEPPRHTMAEAVAWIRKAASQNWPQAAGMLSTGYQWGDYSLPRNAELQACWEKVELEERGAETCLDLEKALLK